jgi:hypothetical protein
MNKTFHWLVAETASNGRLNNRPLMIRLKLKPVLGARPRVKDERSLLVEKLGMAHFLVRQAVWVK